MCDSQISISIVYFLVGMLIAMFIIVIFLEGSDYLRKLKHEKRRKSGTWHC